MRRRLIVAYVLIGLAWGTFCAYKGYQTETYAKEDAYYMAPVNVVVNAAFWPVSVPLGIYRIANE